MARKKSQSKAKENHPIRGVDFELYGKENFQVTKDELISLAEAMNDIFQPDEEIDTEAGIKELGAEVTDFFDEVFTTDDFEDEQWATLFKMGCMPIEASDDEEEEAPVEEWPDELMDKVEPFLPEEKEEESEPEEPEPKKKGKGKKKKEPEPEPPEEKEEEEEEESVEDLLKKLKKLKKKSQLDEFVEENEIDVDTSERNPIKFKKIIADALKGETPEPEPEKKSSKKGSSKKEKAPKKEKSSKKEKAPKKEKAVEKTPTRAKSHEESFMDALDKLGAKKKGTTMDELAEKGNEIYCKANGGEGSEAMQRKQGLVILKALIRYGVVEKEGKAIFLLEDEE